MQQFPLLTRRIAMCSHLTLISVTTLSDSWGARSRHPGEEKGLAACSPSRAPACTPSAVLGAPPPSSPPPPRPSPPRFLSKQTLGGGDGPGPAECGEPGLNFPLNTPDLPNSAPSLVPTQGSWCARIPCTPRLAGIQTPRGHPHHLRAGQGSKRTGDGFDPAVPARGQRGTRVGARGSSGALSPRASPSSPRGRVRTRPSKGAGDWRPAEWARDVMSLVPCVLVPSPQRGNSRPTTPGPAHPPLYLKGLRSPGR